MKVTSYERLEPYEVDGNILSIYWGEESHPPKEDEIEPYWTYDCCKAHTYDSRSTLIEMIIQTKYPTTGSEIAAIQNGGKDAEEHQQHRTLAKSLVDGWFISSKN